MTSDRLGPTQRSLAGERVGALPERGEPGTPTVTGKTGRHWREPGRIQGFDGLRALAFLMVFVSHKAPSPLTERLGTAGVWIFFVLSGFLITQLLLTAREDVSEGRTTVTGALIAFYVRRIARIFPVYYLFLAVVTVLGLAGLVDTGEFGRQASMWVFMTNIYVVRHGWATELGHLWSLAVEEQFYLLFAPAVLLMPKRLLALPVLACLVVSILAHASLLAEGSPPYVFDASSLTNFGLLGLGGLLALVADRPLPPWLTYPVTSFLAAAGFLAAAVLMRAPGEWLAYGRLAGVLVALFLLQLYQDQTGPAARILSHPWLVWMGNVSFAAYLFHPVIRSDLLAQSLGLPVPGHLAAAVLDMVLTLALAGLSGRLLEHPLRARGRVLADRLAPSGRARRER